MLKLKRFPLALASLCATTILAGCASTPRPLFEAKGESKDFSAFELITTPAATLPEVLSAGPDGVITVAGKPAGYVATRAAYTNYRLHAEWRWSGKPGNGGVLLHITSGPRDGVWPLSQQVQTKHGFAGDLLPMAGASFTEPLSTAPGAYPAIKAHTGIDSEHPAGEWNSMDVVSRDGTIEVSINGVAQNRVTGAVPRTGHIGFQLEGAPYELRNVTITQLD
jgi:hypothetical protein